MILNILVAVAKQFSDGTTPNFFNGLAGLMVIACFPGLRSLSVDKKGYRDLLWDVPYLLIFGYTFWDLIYVYSAFPESTGRMIIGLLVPLLIAFYNRKLYLQARIFTLAFYFVLEFTFPISDTIFATPRWENPLVESVLSYLSFAFMLCYSFYHFIYKRLTAK